MSLLNKLPREIINNIANQLNEADRLSLDEARREPMKKSTTEPKFMARFKTVKISLCKLSVDTLNNLTSNAAIAAAIEHLIIGTETLDQYRHLITDAAFTEQQRTAYNTILFEEEAINTTVATTLQTIICERLPNLKAISNEDRPAYNTMGSCNNDPFSSQGQDEIKRRTGIDLRWNGPYAAPNSPPSADLPVFPIASRTYAYMIVFTLLRNLKASGKHVKFDIVMRGYYGVEGVGGECEGYVPEVFDASRPLPQRAIETQLSGMSVETYGAASIWLDRLGASIALLSGVAVEQEGVVGESAAEWGFWE